MGDGGGRVEIGIKAPVNGEGQHDWAGGVEEVTHYHPYVEGETNEAGQAHTLKGRGDEYGKHNTYKRIPWEQRI